MPRAGSAGDDEAAARCNPATPSGMLFDRTRSPDGTWPVCNSSKCQNRRFPSAGRTAKHATRPITGGCDSQVPPRPGKPRTLAWVTECVPWRWRRAGWGTVCPSNPHLPHPPHSPPPGRSLPCCRDAGEPRTPPLQPYRQTESVTLRHASLVPPGRPLPGQPTGHSAANSGQLISNDPIWQPCPRDVAE